MPLRAACAATLLLVAQAVAGCGDDGMASVRARLGDGDAQRALAERLLAPGASPADVAEGLEWLTRAARYPETREEASTEPSDESPAEAERRRRRRRRPRR